MSDTTFSKVHIDHAPKTGLIKTMLERAREHYPSPKLVRLHLSLESAGNAVRAFEQLAANRSPTTTPEAHALKVSAASQKLADAALRLEAEIFTEHARLRANFDSEIRSKAKLEPLASGVEIRQAMRQMSEKDRMTAVSKAFKDGDHEVLSALINGNLITTSIHDSLRKDYTEQFEIRMAPELVTERAQLDGLLQDSSHPLRQARQVAKDSTDLKYISEIQKAADAASKIESDFEASIS